MVNYVRFLYTLTSIPGIFLKIGLEQLFYRETLSACSCKNKLPRRRYLRHFLKAQEAKSCSLQIWYLLKANSIAELFLEVCQNFQSVFKKCA